MKPEVNPAILDQTRLARRILRILGPTTADAHDAPARPAFDADLDCLDLPADYGPGKLCCLKLPGRRLALVVDCHAGDAGLRFAFRLRSGGQLQIYARGTAGKLQINGESLPVSEGNGRALAMPGGIWLEWSLAAGQTAREFLVFQPDVAPPGKAASSAAGAASDPDSDPDSVRLHRFAVFDEPRIGLAVDRLLETLDAPGPESLGLATLIWAWMEEASGKAAAASFEESGDGAASTPQLPVAELRKIRSARAILFQEYLNPPTIARLSRLVALNECKLKRGYRLVFQTSIYADLRRYRMHMARDLLIAGETNVAAAACAVGYSNPGHFARAFQAEFGVKPGRLTRGNFRTVSAAYFQQNLALSPESARAPFPDLHYENNTQSH